MPLKGIPTSVSPELLYVLAKMGHGDMLVIADANFPSDSTAVHTITKVPIRVHGSTSDILTAILTLLPLDLYVEKSVLVMDRVDADKQRDLAVPAYAALANAANLPLEKLGHVERFNFYDIAKQAFAVVQTDDASLYANAIIFKGVL